MTPPLPVTAPARRRLLLAVALGGLLLCGFSVVGLAALGSTIEADLRLSHTWLGVLQSATFTGNLLGSLIFAHFIRRHRLGTLGLASLGLLILGNLLSALPYLPTLLSGRLALGLANCGMMLFGSTLAMRAWPSRQDAMLNLVHGTVAGGATLGMISTLPLTLSLGHWQRLPVLLAAAFLPGLAVLLWRARAQDPLLTCPTPPTANGEAPPQLLRAWGRLLRDPVLARVAPVLFAYLLAETAIITFYPILAQGQARMTAGLAATLTGLFIGGIVLGRFLVAGLLGQRDPRRVTVGLLLAGTVVLLSVLATQTLGPWALAGLLTLGGGVMGPVAPLAIGLVVRDARGTREDTLALTNALLCLGGLLGASLVGWGCDHLGVWPALALSLLIFALTAAPLLRPLRPAPAPA